MKTIEKFHKHIDNGGVSIAVSCTQDEGKQLVIELDTSYFGYPALHAMVHSHGQMSSKDLREIGEMFLKAALKYEGIEKELADRQ